MPRTSTQSSARPGTTFKAPGETFRIPTVPTIRRVGSLLGLCLDGQHEVRSGDQGIPPLAHGGGARMRGDALHGELQADRRGDGLDHADRNPGLLEDEALLDMHLDERLQLTRPPDRLGQPREIQAPGGQDLGQRRAGRGPSRAARLPRWRCRS